MQATKSLILFLVSAAVLVKAGNSSDLQAAISGGGTVNLTGEYSGPATLIVPPGSAVKIHGPAKLVNIRLIVESPDIEISNLDIEEQDCVTDQLNYSQCPALGAMLTIGYIGYPVSKAYLHDLTINTTRAYTAIETGYAAVSNLTIQGVQITDKDQSAISIYQGRNIYLDNVSITGQETGWKDDGVAITSVFGPIQGVLVENVTAQYTGDIVGLGSGMQYAMNDVEIKNSQCTGCWYSVMMKTSLTSNPVQVASSVSPAAAIHRLTIDNVVSKSVAPSSYVTTRR